MNHRAGLKAVLVFAGMFALLLYGAQHPAWGVPAVLVALFGAVYFVVACE